MKSVITVLFWVAILTALSIHGTKADSKAETPKTVVVESSGSLQPSSSLAPKAPL